jgi:hypothetical protein
VGWRRHDPVYACAGGRRLWCRSGWLVPADHGPELVFDEYVPPERSAEVPYRPTYGGLPAIVDISTGDQWRIYQDRRAELRRWYERRYTASPQEVDAIAAARSAYRPDDRSARYGYQRPPVVDPGAARSVRSGGPKYGQSRTQPISRVVRPDVSRAPQSGRAVVPYSGSGGSRRGAPTPARNASSRSTPAVSDYSTPSER